MSDYLPLPKITDRIIGQKYMYKNEIVIWAGNRLLCKHNREKKRCNECGGTGICEHGKRKEICKDCGGNQFCEHGTRKCRCKECGGSEICEHGKRKELCKDCGGSQICEHGRRKDQCKDCGGSGICEHGKRKELCKDCGGSQICKHNKVRNRCKECGGSQICEHDREKYVCNICNQTGHLTKILRQRVYIALKNYSTRKDREHTLEYVCCSVEYLRTHLENQFEKEAERCGHPISWENQGEWHIDHIKPCASFDLDLEEERDKCFHYTNLQPMWGPDNMSKSDTYDEAEDKRIWMGRINGWVG